MSARQRRLGLVALLVALAAPPAARADDPATPDHPYGSIDRQDRDEPEIEQLRRGLGEGLMQLPPAERRRTLRRLRAMPPEQRRAFFRELGDLPREQRRERFREWLAEGRREDPATARGQKLHDMRENLDEGLTPGEKRALRRSVDRMTPEQRFALRERMKNLDAGEQREVARRIGRWRRLDEQQKAEVREKLESYRERPPSEREVLRRNVERWLRKTPAERAALREQWRQWQALTPEERAALREELGR